MTFTSHLKKALDDKKIETFIDDDLERGEEITPALLKAIERSMISVIIFSENYASSRWCLDELVHILECREKYGQHVLPIFYETVVSDIRRQSGTYELEERFKERKTESERLKWKVALTKPLNYLGLNQIQPGDKSLDIQGESIYHNTRVKLGRKKVLVVLDDVDDSRQLEILVGHHHVPFGSGSRIMITTRDKRLLDEVMGGGNYNTVIYEVKKLDDVEARQLLQLKAPRDIPFAACSTEVLTKVVKYAEGVPLALRTLRPLFYKGTLNEMQKISRKQIEDAKGLLDGCSSDVSRDISALVEMSLIELRNSKLWMHDVIQEMGREIVRQECPAEAGERSRLYAFEDVYHGTAKVQAFCSFAQGSLIPTSRLQSES
ncbi:disease resistance protein Roq1-like [Argentina anserina]|uniref:disease resistance protein Roq1-like n=1 Tax=Argentina anserina TaxID=57926 RepID=UPI0021762E13|nr:disease resistance protein Roq1-like [Potentilla anserina]